MPYSAPEVTLIVLPRAPSPQFIYLESTITSIMPKFLSLFRSRILRADATLPFIYAEYFELATFLFTGLDRAIDIIP